MDVIYPASSVQYCTEQAANTLRNIRHANDIRNIGIVAINEVYVNIANSLNYKIAVDLSKHNFADLTYNALKHFLDDSKFCHVVSQPMSNIVIMNGVTMPFIKTESYIYAEYIAWQHLSNEKMSSIVSNDQNWYDAVVMFAICEYARNNTFVKPQIINLMHDALQLKFLYTPYFEHVAQIHAHKVQNDTFLHDFHKSVATKIPIALQGSTIIQNVVDIKQSHEIIDMCNNKTLDFVVGISNIHEGFSSRHDILTKMSTLYYMLKRRNMQSYITWKGTGHATAANPWLSKEEYDNKLKLSATTLVVDTYAHNTFAINRFLDAISNCCVPLVYTDNKESYSHIDSELAEIIDKYLYANSLPKLLAKIVKFENVDYRIKVIKRLSECAYIQSLNSVNASNDFLYITA